MSRCFITLACADVNAIMTNSDRHSAWFGVKVKCVLASCSHSAEILKQSGLLFLIDAGETTAASKIREELNWLKLFIKYVAVVP